MIRARDTPGAGRGALTLVVLVLTALMAAACGPSSAFNALDPDVPVVELPGAASPADDGSADDGSAAGGGALDAGDDEDALQVMPDVSGSDVATARRTLEAVGLQVEVRPLMLRSARPGDVALDTLPAAGEPVPEDGRATIRTTVPLDLRLDGADDAARRVIAVSPLRFGHLQPSEVVDAMVLLCEDRVIDDAAVSFPAFDTRTFWYGLGEPSGAGPALARVLEGTTVTESNAQLVLDETLVLLQLAAVPLCPDVAEQLLQAARAGAETDAATAFFASAQPPALGPAPPGGPAPTLTGRLNPDADSVARLLDQLGLSSGDPEVIGTVVASAATACENQSTGADEPLFLEVDIDPAAFVQTVLDVWCVGADAATPPNPSRPALGKVLAAAVPVLGAEPLDQLAAQLGLAGGSGTTPPAVIAGAHRFDTAPGGPIGSSIGGVVEVLSRDLGGPPTECRGAEDRQTSYRWGAEAGLNLYAEDGIYVGFVMGRRTPPEIAHAAGLRVGLDQASLGQAYAVDVQADTTTLFLQGPDVPTIVYLQEGVVVAIAALDRELDAC